jgi:adenosylmethionine-8-amino-7-oxononanoate aminotransferase
MDAEAIVVSRLGLGTINHTLLSLCQARQAGLKVKGVLFSRNHNGALNVAEETNPDVIARLSQEKVLGIVPYMAQLDPEHILRASAGSFDIDDIINAPPRRLRRYQADDKKYVWHPFTQMKDWLKDDPLVIERAQGPYLYDTEGRKYLDGVSSLWVNVHGHNHPEINTAIKDQLGKLEHSTMLGLTNVPAVELAKELVAIAPKGLSKVFYSDNGSTAVEVALKMAYQYWQNTGKKGKTAIVHLDHAYHGDTLGGVSVGGIDLFRRVYKNLTFKSIPVFMPDGYRAPKGRKYPEYAFGCLKQLEALFKKKSRTIAALIVEPKVQGAAGMIVWPEGLLRKMAALCKRHGVLFIADEVATGFGRTGAMFACDQEGVSPDIMCVAKGLTGGYLPLAATLTSKRIYDGFLFDYKDQKTFFHGHTYTGNPLGAAAALASLKLFKKERTLAKLQPKIKYLAAKLQMFYNLAHVGHVRQCGFMAGIELVKDQRTKEPYDWQERIGVRVCQEVRKKGVILRPLGNVIVLMPPLSINKKEIDLLVGAAYEAIEKNTKE